MHTVDETNLLQRLRLGDEAAFEQLVGTYSGRMLAVARGLLRNEEDARDVVQSAYVSAFRGLPTFKGTSRLSTWLHRIVVNGALMRLRSRRRKPEESIEVLLPAFLEDGHHSDNFSDWAAQADRLLESKQMRQVVRTAIAELPESHRAVLVLRDIEDMTTEEAAVALGISTNAVKIRLHRARQALATLVRRRVGNRREHVGIEGASWRTIPRVETPAAVKCSR
jgi:RNA polymerase sigma-70 factor (ECF subfamily)